jgi:hypothetical protein
MKFSFDTLYIWLKNGKLRTLNFLPNKVNIITGGSGTGKTAILDIIDYCLFASTHKISDSIINENAAWYGIRFNINDKCYFIARKSPTGNEVSSDYYFSSVGELPDGFPVANTPEATLKVSLESDFSIDRDAKVSYGGKLLKAGSKISLRYFLVFNTISQDIITHSEEFFDKQKDDRYREALPRIFDLSVGIDTVENIIKREKRDEIERKIIKIEREGERISKKQNSFYSQLSYVVKTAKEYSLVQEDADVDGAISVLREMVNRSQANAANGIPEKYAKLSAEINETTRKIKNLQRFTSEYKSYKENLKKTNDSLKPIDFLEKNHSEIIKTSIFDSLVSALAEGHTGIKKSIAEKTPLDSNVSAVIKDYEDKLKQLRESLALLPEEVKTFENDSAKLIFIGETKAKLDLYEDGSNSADANHEEELKKLRKNLEELLVAPVEERKSLFVKVLDDVIQDYISEVKEALDNYNGYLSSFNYKEKKLELRKPKTDFIDNVGSSSNHMFLHLFLFLGLHALILKRKAPHVPPFLIIDQFSRPYWGGKESGESETLRHSDISKVKLALKLLNGFIDSINTDGGEFQMIVFEHIGEELWKDLPNIHLVEEFRNGNALIQLDRL